MAAEKKAYGEKEVHGDGYQMNGVLTYFLIAVVVEIATIAANLKKFRERQKEEDSSFCAAPQAAAFSVIPICYISCYSSCQLASYLPIRWP